MRQTTSSRTISPAFVHLLHDYLKWRGLDPLRILGEAPPDGSAQPTTGFPVTRWANLLQRASQALDDPPARPASVRC
jgi:hypothetical protein